MFIGCCLMFASCAQGQQQDRAPEQESVTVIAQNLHVPWGMEQLPDGNLLFTERNGRINMLNLATGVSTTLMIRPVNDQAEGRFTWPGC
jgi:glucose/arabinose dehydrogenase